MSDKKTPLVCTFSAEPAVPDGLKHNRRHLILARGTQAKLTWMVQNADKVRIKPGIGELIASANSVQVSPSAAETTYMLVAVAKGGACSKPACVSISLKEDHDDDVVSPVVIVKHPKAKKPAPAKPGQKAPDDDDPAISEVDPSEIEIDEEPEKEEQEHTLGIKFAFKHKFEFGKSTAAQTMQGAESWFETEGALFIEAEGALNPDATVKLNVAGGDAEKGLEVELEKGEFFTWKPGSFFSPVKFTHELGAKFFSSDKKEDWTIASVGGKIEITFGDPDFGSASGELEAISIKRKEGKWSIEVAEVTLESKLYWKGKKDVELGKYKGELEGTIAGGGEFKIGLNMKKLVEKLFEDAAYDVLADVLEGATAEVFLGFVAEAAVFALPLVVFAVVLYELFEVWQTWKDVQDVMDRYEALRRGFHEGIWATLENKGEKPEFPEPDKEDAYGQGKKQGLEAGEKYWAVIFEGDKKKGTPGVHQKFMKSKQGNKWYWDKKNGGESDPDIDKDLLDLVSWGLKKNGSIDAIIRDAMRRIEEKLRHDMYLAFVKTHDDAWYKEPGWMPRDAVFQYLYRTEIKYDDYDQPGVPDDVYYVAIKDAWYLHDKKGDGKKGRKQKVAPPPADGKPLPHVKETNPQAKPNKDFKDTPAKKKDEPPKKKAAPPPPPPPPPPKKAQEPPPAQDPDWPGWVPPGKRKPFSAYDEALDAAGWTWANSYKVKVNGVEDQVYFPGTPPPSGKVIVTRYGFLVVDAPQGATYSQAGRRVPRHVLPSLKAAMEALGWRQAIRGAFYTNSTGTLSEPEYGWVEYRNGKPVVTKEGDPMIAEENGQYRTDDIAGGPFFAKWESDKGGDAIVSL